MMVVAQAIKVINHLAADHQDMVPVQEDYIVIIEEALQVYNGKDSTNIN